MKTEKLNYELPTELIAQQPASIRSDSRLLVLGRVAGAFIDTRFSNLGDFLSSGDCLILNDTKVLPAKFFARRRRFASPAAASCGARRSGKQKRSSGGGKLEGLFLEESSPGVWEVLLKGIRRLEAGDVLYLKDKERNDFCKAVLLEKTGQGRCRLKIENDANAETVLDKIGFPPLPPYIKRDDDPAAAELDKQRYQTVYARTAGAVAAPTAGLHFTNRLIEKLQHDGIVFAYITLHVGTGTFKPVTTENLEDHQIHQERFSIDTENARIINAAKNKGGRIIAVGTTSTRVLETAAGPQIKATTGTTELFITPGYKFKFIDAMLTNFHLPRTTLLALVAAFAGLDNILAAYGHAVEQRYRFYSYGDAMLII